MGHVRFLDGLRALAILMVIGLHASNAGSLQDSIALPGLLFFLPTVFMRTGGVGVEIFFFISGFALFYPYAQSLFEERPLQTLAHYAKRRIAKIVPSYILALTVMTIFFPLFVFGSALPIHFARHLFFIHGFWHESFWSISGPFWSLAVEVQFYAVFPLIALCLMRSPLATLACLVGISVSYHVALSALHVVRDAFWVNQLPGYISLFGFGSFTAYLIVRDRNHSSRFPGKEKWCTAAAGLAMVVLYGMLGSALSTADTQQWLNGTAEIFGLTLCVLVYGLAGGTALWRSLCEHPILLWISDISYNLYLWNENILRWYHLHIAPIFSEVPYAQALNALLSLALVAFIAWAMTKWVEKPILQFTRGRVA
jgi:peptidoglycan/LPS O-acetylase OafA/YrhL